MEFMEKEIEKSECAKQEEEILKFWRTQKIFEKSLIKPAPGGEFVFYDGPPFATGLPHFGHLLPTSLKDAIPRYQTMRGRRVTRRWGWDCHGLPIENLIEKELGLKSKKDIEEYGLELFNQKARASVLRYATEWQKVIPRMGRWVDMVNDYKTMDSGYTESVWWVFKTLHDKGLVYEGYKSMHLCPRCETTLANFEVNLGYKDITDLSVYMKFELVDKPGTYLLVWTTTPWTLPGNVALAINPKTNYVRIKMGEIDENYILAKDKIAEVLKDKNFEVVEEFAGERLIGKKYKPLFDYYQGSTLRDAQGRTLSNDNGWQIYAADFVITEEGTGVVHIAPAFGEDDMRLGEEKNLPFIQHVTRDGRFEAVVKDFAGLPVKPKDDSSATDVLIIKYLAKKNLLLAKKKITHSYPHCWRCDTPLLNYAANSWFIKVTELKDKLLAANRKVNWLPEHIRDGRFGKWLEGARDWAVSRQRFWGAPLPIWRCEKCKKVKVLGGLEDLKKNVKKSGNKYFVMRHGEAENNVKNILSSRADNPHHLTERGRAMVQDSVLKLKTAGIDLIISSDFLRARETAEIVAQTLGLGPEAVVHDVRLGEMNHGDFNNQPLSVYRDYFKNADDYFTKRLPNGESYLDAKRRMGDALYDLESKYRGRSILIISHESPIWLLFSAAAGVDAPGAQVLRGSTEDFIKNAEVRTLSFVPLPHNRDYELDFHRPYIDQIKLACECLPAAADGNEMTRIEDVFDVWFESGSMPYGQAGYHGQAEKFPFPADFIAEGLDQTRGWFYSLLVLGVGLLGESPYRNVIVNGLILAEDGQKMSKRLNNYPDLNLTINKYGADALRFYLLSSPAVHADDFNFSEAGLGEMMRRVIIRLRNVLAFYQLYPVDFPVAGTSPDYFLDSWIWARWNELRAEMTEAFDHYQVDLAVRPIDTFIDDLSTWYLRRSRDRLRSLDVQTSAASRANLRAVLGATARLIAPVTPFLAEEIWQARRAPTDPESVHLADWPREMLITEKNSQSFSPQSLIENMRRAREIVSRALEKRSQGGIKVRQPLARLKIKKSFAANLPADFLELIKEEVNVVEAEIADELTEEIWLDTTITPELKLAERRRELVRLINDERKKVGLSVGESATLLVVAGPAGRQFLDESRLDLARTAVEIKYNAELPDGLIFDIGTETIKLKITNTG